MDLYQASLKTKGKKVESYSNTLNEANDEANNALITNDPNTLIDIKGLDVLDFFKDPDGKIDYLIGGVLGPNN